MSNFFGRLEDEIRYSDTRLRGGELIWTIVFKERDDVRGKDRFRVESARPHALICLWQFLRSAWFVSLRDKCAFVDGNPVPGGSELCVSLREFQLCDGDSVFLATAEGKSSLHQDCGSPGDLFGSVSGFPKLEG